MSVRLFVFALILGLLATAQANAATTGNPIRITSCAVNFGRAGVDFVDPWGMRYYQPSTSGNVRIGFTNLGSKPASAIDFGLVVSNVVIAEARDTGKFAPGATIEHELGLSASHTPSKSAKLECVALVVQWDDGTYYRSPRISTLTRLNAK